MDLGLILGIALIAIVAIYALIGLGMGFGRTLIRMLFSSVICLVAAAAVVIWILPLVLDAVGFDLYGEIAAAIEGVDFLGFLTKPLGIDLPFEIVDTILNFAILALELVVSYIVCKILFAILKVCLLRFVRPVRSKTVDYVFGVAFWGAIGFAIVAAIVIGIIQLYNNVDFIAKLEIMEFVKGDNLFTTIAGWIEKVLDLFKQGTLVQVAG